MLESDTAARGIRLLADQHDSPELVDLSIPCVGTVLGGQHRLYWQGLDRLIRHHFRLALFEVEQCAAAEVLIRGFRDHRESRFRFARGYEGHIVITRTLSMLKSSMECGD